jgi:pimeloyl-ACP methyl ester carboxylesterase
MSTNFIFAKGPARNSLVGLVLIALALLFASLAGSTTASAATRSGKKPGHVYLMRGILNVFSLGMDQLAYKLEAAGVTATVSNHSAWSSIADEIIANYRAGNHEPVILMGHSLGADATISTARKLAGFGIPVALIVNFDPTSPDPVPSNVRQIVNYYVPAGWGRAVAADSRFKGNLANVNENATDNHFSIDKSEDLHRKTIAKVLQVVSAPRPRTHRPPAPKPAQVSAAPAQ